MSSIVHRTATLATALLALAALTPPAAGHTAAADEHGVLYADLRRGDAACSDAYAVARHLDAAAGTLQLYAAREGSAPDELLHEQLFLATPETEGDGFRFDIGPFQVEEEIGGHYFVASWTDAEGEHQLYASFEGNCVPIDCIEHRLVVTTGDQEHPFYGRACAAGSVPDDCLSFALTLEPSAGTLIDTYDECAPDEDAGEEGACIDYVLRVRTAYHDVVMGREDCPGSEPSCVTYELEKQIGDQPQSTWETDCQNSPCEAEGLVAVANDDGSVTLTWPGDEDALYDVSRATNGGDVKPLAVVTGTTYVDTDTTPGDTYSYVVFRPSRDISPMCAEVTAVPFFGAPVFAALAALGGCGAYAWMRRR